MNIGDYIALNIWCNTLPFDKETLDTWCLLPSNEKTDEKASDLFPAQYLELKNAGVDTSVFKFCMSDMLIGEFKDGDEQLPEPDKKQNDGPLGAEKKNRMEFRPSAESVQIKENIAAEILRSIPLYKNLTEYMLSKYLTAGYINTAVDGLEKYYKNSDDMDLMTFLNRGFDYHIIKQWFAEGCLVLMNDDILPIMPD